MKLKFNPQPKPVSDQPKPKSAEVPPNLESKIKPRSKFKPQPGYIRLTFTIAHSDFYIIRKCIREKGLDDKNYSAALRLILREWKAWHDRQGHPLLIALPPDMLPANNQPNDDS